MFFFRITEEVIICLSDYGKSMYMSDAFFLYYWRGNNVQKVILYEMFVVNQYAWAIFFCPYYWGGVNVRKGLW